MYLKIHIFATGLTRCNQQNGVFLHNNTGRGRLFLSNPATGEHWSVLIAGSLLMIDLVLRIALYQEEMGKGLGLKGLAETPNIYVPAKKSIGFADCVGVCQFQEGQRQ